MKKMKSLALIGLLSALTVLVLAGCNNIKEVPAEASYGFENPALPKAEPDSGFVIDGVLDEAAYQNNNWLYLHNEDGGNTVDIAMTSYYGENGMYFVYDVTETVPIYVNPKRNSALNSCIEMYLAPSYLSTVQDNSIFEIDLMPTGDMSFRKSNGAYGYTNVITTNENMAVLGATTKGGEVNTKECYGYNLELFIPWAYMQWLDVDVESMRNGFVYVNPAHITSNNYEGTDVNLDRYWYFYAQQNGAEFTNVSQYFRFNGQGVLDTVPVVVQPGENCTVTAAPRVIPGMNTVVTIQPDAGYAVTSVIVDQEEWIRNVDFNEDGSVTVTIRSGENGINVSAKAEKTTDGTKTLSGKIVLNNMNKDTLEGLVLSYFGPKGERPLEIDGEGNFQLTNLEQGYYVLKAEKEGYKAVSRSVFLNRDIQTDLVLEYDAFTPTQGACWILDDQNNGKIYKMGGSGALMGNRSYHNFDYALNLKYDDELAKQGTSDFFYQQRSGMRIAFSNGKTWHIDILRENDKYILQYAKMSGENSATNWKTIHTLTSSEIARYKSEEGVELRIMRQGRHMAVWLNNKLHVIEVFGATYASATAKVGMEAWIANRTVMDFPFRVSGNLPVNVAGSPFHWPAEIWDISNQYNGTISKYPAPGKDTWLDGKLDVNDVTIVAKDLSPETNDYCFVYIFKFSNGESFRVRLNHTDDDGKYRIQSFSGSTLFAPWKNHYTLTDEQAEKVKTEGIAYRVQILDTTAYVYLDGQQVCTYDLSTNVNTGKPSGIENATSTVSFRLDGNTNGITKIPFHFENNSKKVTLIIAQSENGTIKAQKESYNLGDTVKLTVSGNEGFYYNELYLDGQPVSLDWDGTYSFVASKNRYEIIGTFAEGFFEENKTSSWNLINQNKGLLQMTSHASGNSGILQASGIINDVTTTVQDLTPNAKDFSMIYNFTFSNGEKFNVRLNHTDNDGKYRIQSMSGSTLFEPWKNAYTLTASQEAKVQGEGIAFRVVIRGTVAYVYLDGQEVCTYDLSKVVATGKPSGIADADASVAIRMDGNLNQTLTVPFALADSKTQVQVNIPKLDNGTVTSNQVRYQIGDTVTLIVAPNAGYSQKLYINGKPLLLDWKTNTCSFVATENIYDITGSFTRSLNLTASDTNRWDTANQAHGVLTTSYPVNNDSWWMDVKGEYTAISVKAKNYLSVAQSMDGNGKVGFAVILRVTMDNGKVYAFRVINDKGTYAYDRYGSGGSLTGWGNWKNLSSLSAAFNGEGVDFKLERTGANKLTMSVNGTVMETYTMDGVTAANKVVSVSVQHNGNPGPKITLPVTLTKPAVPEDAPTVQLNIGSMANGSVVAGASSYRVGETVVLKVTPDAGYSQKLYINGKPLMMDWKTDTCSFEATEQIYNITGGFEKTMNIVAADNGRIDTANQAHGVLNSYYPANNDTGWVDFQGQYDSISVKAKNYWPVESSYEGIANGGGFRVALRANLDTGKSYAFSIWIDTSKRYAYNHFGASGSVTGWSGAWCEIKAKDPVAYELLNGEGADFKLERIDGNHFRISINGTVLETYTIPGVTEANKVVSVGVCYWGNKGEQIQIPFEVVKAAVSKAIAHPAAAALPTGKEEYNEETE